MEETSGIVTVMEEVEIFTIPALFTLYKVDRESIYPGLHLYEIQARQDTPFRLMEWADSGFYGSILTPIPVDRMENGRAGHPARRLHPDGGGGTAHPQRV